MRTDCVNTSSIAAKLLALGLCGVTVLTIPAFGDDTPVPAPQTPTPAPTPTPPPPNPAPSPVPTTPVPSPMPSPVPVPVPSPTPTPDDNPTTPPADDTVPPDPAATPSPAASPTPDPAGKNGKTDKKDAGKDKDKTQEPERTQYQGNSVGRYFGKNFLGDMFQNVYVAGGTSLTSRSFSVDGSASAQSQYKDQYTSQGFGAQQVGPFQQNMDLTINGKVWDAFTLNGRFTNSRQGNYFNQIFGLNYRAKGTSFAAGDVSAALPGNEFVNFSRTVRGLSFGRDFGNGMRIQGVGSYTQAVARRGTFQGNGTTGPYQLQSSSILEGTERVQKNGVDLVAGQDYQIDYPFGQIKFLNSQIINPEDTIVYTYEAQNYNSQPGLLTGLRYDLTPKSSPYNVGFTWLQQKALSGQRGVQEITERFPVNAELNYQYPLVAGIEDGTIPEVRYLEQKLIENVDYVLVRPSRFFRLLKKYPEDTALNASSSLSIKYRPVKQASLNGDRAVYGIDGGFKFGQNTNVAWQYGRSQNTVQGSNGGDALSMNATFGGGGGVGGGVGAWNATLGYRNIGSSYSGIDSISSGLLRAEDGLRGTFQYRPTSYLSFTTSMNQSRLGNSTTAINKEGKQETLFSWNKNNQMQGSFSLALPNLPRMDFSHSQIDQKAQTGTTSSHYQSDQLNLNHTVGMLSFTGSVGRTMSRGQSVFSSGFTNNLSTTTTGIGLIDTIGQNAANLSSTDSSSNTGRLALSLNPASWISLSGAMGLSQTRYGNSGSAGSSGTSSNARDTTLGVRLPLRPNLSLGFDWSSSTNGQNSTQASQSGYGIAAQNTNTYSMDMRYQPMQNLEMTMVLGRTKYLIPGFDNTDTNNRQFSLTYAPVPQLTFIGLYSSNMVRYLGSQTGNSGDDTYQLQATAGPFPRLGGPLGKITFSSSWQSINTGSSLLTSYSNDGSVAIGTNYGATGAQTIASGQQQRMNLFSLRADYPIATRQSIYLSWQNIDSISPLAGTGTDTSYYTASNYKRGNGSIGYDFRFNEFMGLSVDWSLIQMRDREQQNMSYRARALNVDLNAHF